MIVNSTNPTQATKVRRISKGDIRRMDGLLGLPEQPRLALIIRTADLNQDYTEIMLVHDRVQMATLDDVIVYPEPDQFANGFVVQTLLRGAVGTYNSLF